MLYKKPICAVYLVNVSFFRSTSAVNTEFIGLLNDT
jgi:hypothetical protein